MSSLKELYEDYFKIGVGCESIHDRFTNNEIGNPEKEKLIIREFNSMTFGNELKPAYNMGFSCPEAKEDYLPFVINPQAKIMLDFAKSHGIKVRGHVLVWHSQCSKEIFCKGYEPVTYPTDPEILKDKPFMKNFEKLNPVCYTDRKTMLERLRSYIFSIMEYMYANGYADTIYAWDVVNEAIELADKQPDGLRNSYWYQVIGGDFIYYSFKYAKAAVEEMSQKYAAAYNVNKNDASSLKKIKPLLFYNDYNEFQPDKKKAIIEMLDRRTDEHGSLLSEGLIDGIGMQGHISDNNDIYEFIEALMDYSELVDVIHITELDVKCTCLNVNAEYYQAVFYKKLFESLIKSKEEGSKLESVTFWGLTDDNSWIRGANPLLFHKDLSPKKSYYALKYALTGEDLGEPEKIIIDLGDHDYDFSLVPDENKKLEDVGIKVRGFAHIEVQDRVVHEHKYALAHEIRFDDWSGISFDVSDFIGQTVEVSAWVKSKAKTVFIKSDITNVYPLVAEVSPNDEWTRISGKYKVPSDMHSLFLYFGTTEEEEGKFSAIYVDEIKVKLYGLEEGFEDKTNIASIRGMGHLPTILVTDKESREKGGHSLLVTRQEKDATVKFNISVYLGLKVKISAYVKTADDTVKIGIDGSFPTELAAVKSEKNGWTYIEAVTTLNFINTNSAEFYIETDGNSDYYIDDIFVTRCED